MSFQSDHETILERLIRMEAKLDGYLFRTSKSEAQIEQLDARVRHLEASTAKVVGVAGVVALVVTAFGATILDFIT